MRPEPSLARSVVAWGNAFLRGQVPMDALAAWWPSTRFVRALYFRDGEQQTAITEWLASQGARGATKLLLDTRGPVGAESVIVVCELPSSAWRQQWSRIAGATAAPWFDATFSREALPETLPATPPAPEQALDALTTALEGLVALAERSDLGQWGDYFAHVLAVARGARLEGDSPLPPTASATVHRLARAGNLADVFGGMGSWNDFVPLCDGASENERLRCSALLYQAMKAALAATAQG